MTYLKHSGGTAGFVLQAGAEVCLRRGFGNPLSHHIMGEALKLMFAVDHRAVGRTDRPRETGNSFCLSHEGRLPPRSNEANTAISVDLFDTALKFMKDCRDCLNSEKNNKGTVQRRWDILRMRAAGMSIQKVADHLNAITPGKPITRSAVAKSEAGIYRYLAKNLCQPHLFTRALASAVKRDDDARLDRCLDGFEMALAKALAA